MSRRGASRKGAGPRARARADPAPCLPDLVSRRKPCRHHRAMRIVVGVDGSPSSIEALEWALGQAILTGSTIDAVCAWHYPSSLRRCRPGQYADYRRAGRRDAGQGDRRAARTADRGLRRRTRFARSWSRRTPPGPCSTQAQHASLAGGRLPRARRAHRGAARLGQPARRRTTPPARSSSSGTGCSTPCSPGTQRRSET